MMGSQCPQTVFLAAPEVLDGPTWMYKQSPRDPSTGSRGEVELPVTSATEKSHCERAGTHLNPPKAPCA